MKNFFITGIGTDVGKTVVSAILTEALEADYWKPIQAGDLEYSDTDRVKALISNSRSQFHPSTYGLRTPMSPHAAAVIDNIEIRSNTIILPNTENALVIEGAGGLLVPINNQETILDIIQPKYKVIVVSKHYLGSINHTLMTIELLQQRGLTVSGIIFNGNQNPTTENVILGMTGVKQIGRIDEEPVIDTATIKKYALQFKAVIATL